MQARNLSIDYAPNPGLRAFGDREDLLELLDSLLDNTCATHCREQTLDQG